MTLMFNDSYDIKSIRFKTELPMFMKSGWL